MMMNTYLFRITQLRLHFADSAPDISLLPASKALFLMISRSRMYDLESSPPTSLGHGRKDVRGPKGENTKVRWTGRKKKRGGEPSIIQITHENPRYQPTARGWHVQIRNHGESHQCYKSWSRPVELRHTRKGEGACFFLICAFSVLCYSLGSPLADKTTTRYSHHGPRWRREQTACDASDLALGVAHEYLNFLFQPLFGSFPTQSSLALCFRQEPSRSRNAQNAPQSPLGCVQLHCAYSSPRPWPRGTERFPPCPSQRQHAT